MTDLENRPQYFMPLLALVRSVLGVFHLVGEFEQGVFDVVKAVWWRLAVACGADGRHGCVRWLGLEEAGGSRGQDKKGYRGLLELTSYWREI